MIKKIKVFIKKQNGGKACLFDNFACFSVFFFKRTLFDFCKYDIKKHLKCTNCTFEAFLTCLNCTFGDITS